MSANKVRLIIKEAELNEQLLEELISFSEDWEQENSCYGYCKNTAEDIEGNRVFLAVESGETVGYLFGRQETTNRDTSVFRKGETCFEVEELYVKPTFRGRGIGRLLFQFMEEQLAGEVDLIMLSTATKNYRAILHFYIDELDMSFWNARLFKRI